MKTYVTASAPARRLLTAAQLHRTTAGGDWQGGDVRISTSSSPCVLRVDAATGPLAGFLWELGVVVSGPSGWAAGVRACVRALFRARQGRALVRYEYIHPSNSACSFVSHALRFSFSSCSAGSSIIQLQLLHVRAQTTRPHPRSTLPGPHSCRLLTNPSHPPTAVSAPQHQEAIVARTAPVAAVQDGHWEAEVW